MSPTPPPLDFRNGFPDFPHPPKNRKVLTEFKRLNIKDMTVKEAKEILEKEGWTSFQKLSYRPMGIKSPEYEKAIVVQALEVCYDNHIFPLISPEKRDERYKKLKAAFEESHKDAEEGEPVKGEHLNPALHDSAKDFNDSMLDEQAKMIKGLEAQNKKLNDIIASRNNEIWELQEKVKKIAKMGKTIARLNEVIGKKNAQIKDLKIDLEEKADLLECYRFSDKNKEDMISGLKKVNEKYRHQLADVTVAKIDEQALKSAESALVYKDKVIDRLKKKISDAVDILTDSDGFRIISCDNDPIEEFLNFVSKHGRTE